jgi:hypothetical protein
MSALRTAPACLLVAILACSDQTPTDPNSVPLDELGIDAAVTFNERDVPFTWTSYWCGETQQWVGTDHWIEQYVETPSGRRLSAFRTNYKATVTGDPSGNVYKLNGHLEGRVIWDSEGPHVVDNGPENDVLIGHGKTPNIRAHVFWMFTRNANGVWVVTRNFVDVKCQ